MGLKLGFGPPKAEQRRKRSSLGQSTSTVIALTKRPGGSMETVVSSPLDIVLPESIWRSDAIHESFKQRIRRLRVLQSG